MRIVVKLAVVLLATTGLPFTACSSPRRHPPPGKVPEDPTAQPPAERPRQMSRVPPRKENPRQEKTGMAVPEERQPTESTPREIAELVAYYRLDTVQVAIVTREALDEHGLGDHMAQAFRESFSELGMRVLNAEGAPAGRTDEDAIRGLASRFDADLVVFALGTATERDRFGKFLSYAATVKATVYEASGGLVATKELTDAGKRSTDAALAAKTALQAVTDQLGPFLVEQIVRKVGHNVVARRLTIKGLSEHASVARVTQHLRAQPGINDVRLLSWDATSDTARWLVYLQPAAQDNLGTYLAATPKLDVRILATDRSGVAADERKEKR